MYRLITLKSKGKQNIIVDKPIKVYTLGSPHFIPSSRHVKSLTKNNSLANKANLIDLLASQISIRTTHQYR